MSRVYQQRHPERTVLYQVLFHYFEQFLQEYENRFERRYGYLRPIVQEVVEKYLDCGNPKCGFARIRCPDCGAERLLMFSCKTRGFCPTCHAKRREEWDEWMRKKLILDTPHRQVVFTIFWSQREGRINKNSSIRSLTLMILCSAGFSLVRSSHFSCANS